MLILTIYATVLLVAGLLSNLARQTFFSTAVLFLASGLVAGPSVLHLVDIDPRQEIASRAIELALFTVLYVDGMHVGISELRANRELPARALLIGMPVVITLIAGFAHWSLGLSWISALLLAAMLSPTDPVFASAIVGREEVPITLQRLLNIESGLNDGLALPLVIILLRVNSGTVIHGGQLFFDLALGVAIGIVIPAIATILVKTFKLLALSEKYAPLHALAIGMLVLGITSLMHANEFLGAFSAGVTVASLDTETRDAFAEFGELLAELLKLAGVLLFGLMLRPNELVNLGITGLIFAIFTLVVARPASIALAFVGSGFERRQQLVAAWFGPKGFASIFFSMLVLKSDAIDATILFHLVAIVVTLSMVAHSSTDVFIARKLAS